MTAPTNITALRNDLAKLYGEVTKKKSCGKEPELARINTATNVAGKMISTLRTQMEYHAMRKEKPNIKFLNSEAPDRATA